MAFPNPKDSQVGPTSEESGSSGYQPKQAPPATVIHSVFNMIDDAALLRPKPMKKTSKALSRSVSPRQRPGAVIRDTYNMWGDRASDGNQSLDDPDSLAGDDNEHSQGEDSQQERPNAASSTFKKIFPRSAGAESDAVGVVTEIANSLTIPGTEEMVSVLAHDLLAISEREKNKLLAALLVKSVWDVNTANLPRGEGTSGTNQGVQEQLKAMNIRILQLQTRMGFNMTDPLVAPPVAPTVAYSGGLPFGSGPTNPDLRGAFADYGKTTTTMQTTVTEKKPERTEEEITQMAARIRDMGI